jgi:glycerol-3-phosphate dehydrogenase
VIAVEQGEAYMVEITRNKMLANISFDHDPWDLVVIGGGATGLGIALDASSRGLRTLLVERSDFTKGTSSRSTKLVHGGVRYLRQGQVPLVLEALKERGLLKNNAPHLVRPIKFILPASQWWEKWFYTIGLKLYDILARHLSFGKSVMLSTKQVQTEVSTLSPKRLKGGVLYYDGQMDDARLGLALAKTAVQKGAIVLNYCDVIGFSYDQTGQVNQVVFNDLITAENYTVQAKAVVNATGVFVDQIRAIENQKQTPIVRPSQGAHIVLPKRFLPGTSAIIFPKTKDGRVLFAIPWFDRVLVGTTDHFKEELDREPKPLNAELQEILDILQEHIIPPPQREDVLSVFAGLRPLVVPKGDDQTSAAVSREHIVMFGSGGVCHVTGGKWTTYRKMAEDVLDALEKRGQIAKHQCVTPSLKLYGWQKVDGMLNHLNVYGSEYAHIDGLKEELPHGNDKIHPQLPYTHAEVIYAIRHEWAMTVEDVLSRRTRSLLLDAQASIESAPLVAQLMATELNYDEQWIEQQVDTFTALAQNYVWASSEASSIDH